MPIDYTTLPLQPPAPLPDEATDAQRAEWRDLHRIVASYAHGAAQQATAEAMRDAAAAQREMIAVLGPAPAASGLSETFLLSLLRLVLEKPEPTTPA